MNSTFAIVGKTVKFKGPSYNPGILCKSEILKPNESLNNYGVRLEHCIAAVNPDLEFDDSIHLRSAFFATIPHVHKENLKLYCMKAGITSRNCRWSTFMPILFAYDGKKECP